MIWSTRNFKVISRKAYAFYLSNAVRQFMEEEMGIWMNMKQGMLCSKTPEFDMMWDAAEKAMVHAPTRPTVVPPPRRTLHLTPDQIKASHLT